MENIRALEFVDGKLKFIDQTKLPLKEEFVVTENYERIAEAIERLEIRGAPAIGIAAAYALTLAIKKNNSPVLFYNAYDRIFKTRPTAVNLFHALTEMKNLFDTNNNSINVYEQLLEHARKIHQLDESMCNSMAANGLEIFKKKSRVLTHCNTGALATGGSGTALSVIRHAFDKGLVNFVYADETRPLLQGSRLTAWELNKYGIPFSINTDSAAAVLMKHGKVDLVITGSDRIAANGDVANKIGTYNLAVLCRHHNIPFYIAAPTTTIDRNSPNGDSIKIELRNKKELTNFGALQITCEDYDVYNPAFDVTPNHFIHGIITEKSLHKPPYDFSNV
ncbi:MAG: S-methyl-5-thioribose-1-phosphate isomerase [Bacteroidota bacterium]